MLLFWVNTSANFKYSNNRFTSDLTEINNYIKDNDYSNAKIKLFEYIDKTNLLYCDWYSELKKINYTNADNLLIDNLYDICNNFTNWHFNESFNKLLLLKVNKNNIDNDVYLIYKLLEYSIFKVTNTVKWYDNLYNVTEVNSFLLNNKKELLDKFPISYNFRLWMWYFDEKDKKSFNDNYIYLKNKDYYLKPFIEINYNYINSLDVKEYETIFNYENIILEDISWSYMANSYFFVYNILYDYYSKINDKEKEIDNFIKMRNLRWSLNDNILFKYLSEIENLENYKEIIIFNSDDRYYDFIYNFSLLKNFIDNWKKLSTSDYNLILWSYKYLLKYYNLYKLEIENWRTEKSFKNTYLIFWIVQLVNSTDSWKLDIPDYIGIFLENDKETNKYFILEKEWDKYTVSINNWVETEKIWDKNKFFSIVILIIFVFLLLWWLIFVSQKK